MIRQRLETVPTRFVGDLVGVDSPTAAGVLKRAIEGVCSEIADGFEEAV